MSKRKYSGSGMQRSNNCMAICSDVRQMPRDDTREAACKNAENAYYYAKHGTNVQEKILGKPHAKILNSHTFMHSI